MLLIIFDFYKGVAIWCICLLTIILLFRIVIKILKVKYPSVTAGLLEFIAFISMIVPPIVCLAFSIFNAIKNNTGKRRTFLWLAIIILFFGFIKVYVIDSVNPVVSYTTDTNNYLLVDDDISSKSGIIKSVFPESIVSNATDVKYHYYRLTEDDFEITVEYAAEKDFFESEKSRCKATYVDISDVFAEDKNENVFQACPENDSYVAMIRFNNENLTVSYELYHRQ